MTELVNIESKPAETRSIETITAEIVAIRDYASRMMLESAIEIGRRLCEAKEIVPHGEWGNYLKEKVEFSQDTATRLMNVYKGYANRQGSLFGAELNSAALRNLSLTNAQLLLKVPEDEREEFAQEVDAEHISSRELEKLIRERDEAIQRAEDAEHAKNAAVQEEMTARMERGEIESELLAARDIIKELESRPVEVVVQQPDTAELQKKIDDAVAAAVKEASTAAAAEKKAMKDKLAMAEKRKKELEAELESQKKEAADAEKKLIEQQAGIVSMEKERLERTIEDLKKQLAMSDAAVTTFNTLFRQAQGVIGELIGSITDVSDTETAVKLRAATKKMLAAYGKKVAG